MLVSRSDMVSRITLAASVLVLAGCGGSDTAPSPTPTPTQTPAVVLVPIPSGLSATVNLMLSGLQSYLASVLAENQSLLPNNPNSATYIQAKIATLQQPTLFNDVINNRRWAEGQGTSVVGPSMPIATVFM